MSDFTPSREELELMDRLRSGLDHSDPAPTDIAEFARAAFSWRNIDAELADLDFDSIDEDVPAGVRSTATARMISYQAGKWMLDVEYQEDLGRLIGHITPQAIFTVELHSSGAHFLVQSDDQGRFTADGLAPGPMSLILRFDDGQVIKTRWVIL